MLLLWNLALSQQRSQVLKIAANEAKTIADMDVSFRNWIIEHDGVYVPMTQQTPPDAFLNVPEKDIKTPSGRRLTLLSHAYAMRQIYESRARQNLPGGYISSLSHVEGDSGRTALALVDGERMKFVQAFPTRAACLHCHAADGYKIGDINGSITSTVPLAPLEAAGRTARVSLTLYSFLIWTLGLFGIGFAYRRIRLALSSAQKSEERFRGIFEASHDALMTLEPPSWQYSMANPATIEMFRIKNTEESASLTPGDLSPERQPDGRASAEKSKEMIEIAMREGSHFFEWTHKRISGEEFFSTVLLSRIEEGEKTFLQAAVRDITENKRAEEALRQQTEELRAKNDELGRFMRTTIDRELRMVELKREVDALCEKLGQPPRHSA